MTSYHVALTSALFVAHGLFDSSAGQTCSTHGLNAVLNTEVSVYPSVNQSTAIPLYFGLMVAPLKSKDYFNSTITAVQIALDNINDKTDLLKGYSLHYILTVSQVYRRQYSITTGIN